MALVALGLEPLSLVCLDVDFEGLQIGKRGVAVPTAEGQHIHASIVIVQFLKNGNSSLVTVVFSGSR